MRGLLAYWARHHWRNRLRIRDIIDGLSNTIFVGEENYTLKTRYEVSELDLQGVARRKAVWHFGSDSIDCQMSLNEAFGSTGVKMNYPPVAGFSHTFLVPDDLALQELASARGTLGFSVAKGKAGLVTQQGKVCFADALLHDPLWGWRVNEGENASGQPSSC